MGILSFLSKTEEEEEIIVLTSHPYYPTDLKLTNYTEPTYTTEFILISFLSGVIVILAISLAIILPKQTVTPKHKAVFLWFIITGFIHLFFEGYFALNHETIAENSGLFDEMWKEYALSDSRYLTSDPFVVMMESITAVLSLGQLYGLILYYLTELMEGTTHCRPEAYYFWVYFFGANFVWAIASTTLIWQSWYQIVNFAKEDIKRKSKKDIDVLGNDGLI
ncbi:10121_t:CDS:2 [Gigaspora margarita]|uniref:10121_t:CDS:1 n=1 Tax=Gigaspora margarita TaxID=4874 RepID=A0ABM8W022_GIGMA|nr:10121_t:CDS:2 [Gigaspora margarita]